MVFLWADYSRSVLNAGVNGVQNFFFTFFFIIFQIHPKYIFDNSVTGLMSDYLWLERQKRILVPDGNWKQGPR